MSKRVGLRQMQSAVGGCKINVAVYQDKEVTSAHTVEIKGVSYHNGSARLFPKGTYTLSWTSTNEAYFYKWSTEDNVSVEDEYAASTNLIIACGGTLALNLTSLPAWTYDNLVGTIWLEGPGYDGYDTAPTGEIEVREPSGTGALGEPQGGYYDNRV